MTVDKREKGKLHHYQRIMIGKKDNLIESIAPHKHTAPTNQRLFIKKMNDSPTLKRKKTLQFGPQPASPKTPFSHFIIHFNEVSISF